ncbi:hypothetical protein [Crocinitomix algicola]|uniref:hypothetical protein n=1 Tax=Crocinitomix algicola TaxID=1740263 RepID=UPI0008728BCE|nr:hypothetical protein [Crocinitomix algicola]
MQYSIDNNTLSLTVKKSHFILRFLLYFMSCVILLGPIIGFIISIKSGQPFHFKFLIGMAISSIIGFYILRFALWNSFGKEIIELSPESISYTTDYKIYRDKKNHKREGNLTFSYNPIGYIEDQMGCLTINTGTGTIQSVVKMPIIDINTLIKELNTINNL